MAKEKKSTTPVPKNAVLAKPEAVDAAIKARAGKIARQLGRLYPDAHCALVFHSPLELLIATILSAQCTDAQVNKVTPSLFAKFPTAHDFAKATSSEIEEFIRSTGFFRNKAKNIHACCQLLVERHGGEVPQTMAELLELPGVARKTANVVLGNAFGIPGLPVDTHVGRLARRLGLTEEEDPVKVERDVCALVPKKTWVDFGHRLIFHGRAICDARRPRCSECTLAKICPKIGIDE